MIQHVQSENERSTEHVQSLERISPLISDAVASGIRSLQFEDLTYQSLHSLKHNIESIESINNKLAEIDFSEQEKGKEQLLDLQRKCQAIHASTKSVNQTRSVTQSSMEAGDVELF